ncbi:erythropoietin receptor isoform X2 [Narcine bancroftii]|uniref:erythropoietin receptor isoform X2 n=1 Tax=Narcine bancroftii TaxID=1343680 RepID=UPI0038319C8B
MVNLPAFQQTKVLQINTAGSEELKCFTQTLEDFTCVWDEMDRNNSGQYRFFYQYQFQDDSTREECQLSTEMIAANTMRYICSLPIMQVSLFSPLDIEVWLNASVVKRREEMYINRLVVLDPPSNVTVQPTGKPGQLHVQWSPPQFKYLENSLMYEVNFSSAGSNVQKVETIKGKTKCIILKLKLQTEYFVSVRAKPDGVSLDGYWTLWSTPVSAFTDSDLDPLIVSLASILILITVLLLLTILLTYRRMIKETFWPLVPSPENKFDGLFTVYQGNFQEWLGQHSAQVRWNLQFFSTNDPPSALEVLSEIKTFPPGQVKSKHQEIFQDEQSFMMIGSCAFKLQEPWMPLDESRSRDYLQPSDSTREAYIVLNQDFLLNNDLHSDMHSFTQSSNDISEEEMPLQLLFMSPGMKHQNKSFPEEREEDLVLNSSISRQSSQSSGIGHESPVSFGAFDNAKCDPGGQLIYPNPSNGLLGNHTNHPYHLMLDSGVSADFNQTDLPSFGTQSSTGIYTNLWKREDLLENIPALNVLHI